MTRSLVESNLKSKAARAKLEASPKPYWRALSPGIHLGYRRAADGGSWVVRWGQNARDYRQARLGRSDDTETADGASTLSFEQAALMAVDVAGKGGAAPVASARPVAPPAAYTVADAMRDYLDWADTNTKSGRSARQRSALLIIPHLGHIACADITATEISNWLERMSSSRSRHNGTPYDNTPLSSRDSAETIRRRKSSANRVFTIFRAAMNRAWRKDLIVSDTAWRKVKTFQNVDAARERYLEIDECKRLLESTSGNFRNLIEAAMQTGARFGELSAIKVADLNKKSGTLYIRKSKTDKPRDIILTDEGLAFFSRITSGRNPDDDMLVRDCGLPWTRNCYQSPLKAACINAGISPIGIHVLRHTWASLSVMGGMPLIVVAKNLGHSTTLMVEKNYGHLADSYKSQAVRASAPRFGLVSNT